MIFERKKYIQNALKAGKQCRILFISGLQGVGKSQLLTSISQELKSERPPIRILHVKPDEGIQNARDLRQAAHALGIGPSALFIDNAHRIEDLAVALREIIENYAVTVFITGHRSKLRKELQIFSSAEKGGELTTIELYPLSYAEFLEAWHMSDSRDALVMYCYSGGLPQSLVVDPRNKDAQTFSSFRANSFILTEIIEPVAIRNPGQLRTLLALAARSTGEPLPAREVSQAFASERMTISPQSVLDYLSLCSDSGILVPVQTVDIDKDRRIDSSDVWYFGDMGLRSAFVAKESQADLARAEENLAWLKLQDDGWNVSHGRVGYGKHLRDDITFACERGENRIYVQMVANTASQAERIRKREALLAIRDAWPRYLVDSNEEKEDNCGIRQLHIRTLLLEGINI